MSRPPFPPFTAETAAQKVRMAEDSWNTRDPASVALAYTADSRCGEYEYPTARHYVPNYWRGGNHNVPGGRRKESG